MVGDTGPGRVYHYWTVFIYPGDVRFTGFLYRFVSGGGVAPRTGFCI
jgi:hypothetical protein